MFFDKSVSFLIKFTTRRLRDGRCHPSAVGQAAVGGIYDGIGWFVEEVVDDDLKPLAARVLDPLY
jgi:hypothetical protein